MKLFKRYKGNTIIIIVAFMVFITFTVTLMINLISYNRNQSVYQSESVQLFYLTKVALDTTAESLVNSKGTYKVDDYETSDPNMMVPDIKFLDNSGKKIGLSKIKVKRILKREGSKDKPWIEIEAETFMRDVRKSDFANGSNDIKRKGILRISVENPLIQEQDIASD